MSSYNTLAMKYNSIKHDNRLMPFRFIILRITQYDKNNDFYSLAVLNWIMDW